VPQLRAPTFPVLRTLRVALWLQRRRSMNRRKGRGLLVVISGALLVGATAGCPQPTDGCFCGNAASVCHFADGGVCMDFNATDAGDAGNAADGGTDGGQDAGP
jgi:hypothetical protein